MSAGLLVLIASGLLLVAVAVAAFWLTPRRPHAEDLAELGPGPLFARAGDIVVCPAEGVALYRFVRDVGSYEQRRSGDLEPVGAGVPRLQAGMLVLCPFCRIDLIAGNAGRLKVRGPYASEVV